MNFAAPSLLWGVLAVSAAAVLALYLLKPPPRRVTVSSNLIWLRVVRQLKRDPDRWRWWISLALALAIALSFAGALTRDRTGVAGGTERRLVVILDNSPTMSAHSDGGVTRWRVALDRARALLARESPDARVLLADTMGQIATPAYQPRDDALGRMEALVVAGAGAGRVPTLAGESSAAERYWIGDGVAALVPPAGYQIVSAFVATANVGIVSFALREVPSAILSFQASVELANAAAVGQRVSLEIGGQGGPALREDLTLAAGEARVVIFDVSGFADGPLEAKLTPATDGFALDDHAFAYLPRHRPIAVGFAGIPNSALERSLRALTRVALHRLNGPRPKVALDAVVSEHGGSHADHRLPALEFAPNGGSRATLAGDTPLIGTHAHAALAGVSLVDVSVDRAAALPVDPRTDRVLAMSATGVPLIVARERVPRRVSLAFGLDHSTLAFHSALPVLLDSALAWLVPGPRILYVRPGMEVLPHAEIRSLTSEVRRVAAAGSGASLVEITRPGVYRVRGDEEELVLVSNANERAHTMLNRSRFAGDERPPVAAAPRLVANAWMVLLILGIGLLSLEWLTYHRRVTL